MDAEGTSLSPFVSVRKTVHKTAACRTEDPMADSTLLDGPFPSTRPVSGGKPAKKRVKGLHPLDLPRMPLILSRVSVSSTDSAFAKKLETLNLFEEPEWLDSLTYYQYPFSPNLPECLEECLNAMDSTTLEDDQQPSSSAIPILEDASEASLLSSTRKDDASVSNIKYARLCTQEWTLAFDHLSSRLLAGQADAENAGRPNDAWMRDNDIENARYAAAAENTSENAENTSENTQPNAAQEATADDENAFYYFTASFSVHFSSASTAVMTRSTPLVRQQLQQHMGTSDGLELVLAPSQPSPDQHDVKNLCVSGVYNLRCTSAASVAGLLSFLRDAWTEPRARDRAGRTPQLVCARSFANASRRVSRLGRVSAGSRDGRVCVLVVRDGMMDTARLVRLLRLCPGDRLSFSGRVFRDTGDFSGAGGAGARISRMSFSSDGGVFKGVWKDGRAYSDGE
ncbi:MAG: hypothetical protein SGCHY_005352 [Lobulomycetales sp.]